MPPAAIILGGGGVLPDSSVRIARRIYSAMQVNGFRFPSHSYTINMAPADVKKEGASYDLPLAIGILAGDEQVKSERLGDFLMMGELSLDGSLQPIRGALPITLAARREGFKGIILPMQNAAEAAVADGIAVYGMEHLLDVVRFLNGMQQVEPYRVDVAQLFAERTHARVGFCRCARAGERAPRDGGGSCRRAQHADGGSPGGRQIDDGKTLAVHPATAQP